MRIITEKIETCKTCDTAFEYSAAEMQPVPMYPCMKFIICPNCGQQIIYVSDDYTQIKPRVFVEESDENIEKTS